MQRQREARLAVAQARAMYAEEFEVRDPGEVLLSAVADGDAIVQKLKQQVERQEWLSGRDLDLLGDWMDRVARSSQSVLALKLDERRVRMAERDGKQVVELVRGVVLDLGRDPNSPEVRDIILRRLRALQAAQ